MESVKYSKSINLNTQNISLKQRLLFFAILSIFHIFFFVISIVFKIFYQKYYTSNYNIPALFIGLIVESIVLIYYVSKNNKKKKELTDYETIDYISEFPSNHKPAIIAYLMQGENMDGSDITATLLDLVQRKIFLMEQEYRIEDLLNSKINITLTINPNISIENQLCDYEKFLTHWFFDELSASNEVKTSELREKLKNDPNSGTKFIQWQKLMVKEYHSHNFTINNNDNKNFLTSILYFICISLIILPIFIPINISITLEILLFFITQCIAARISLNDIGNMKTLSYDGRNITRKWNGFINFVKTHSIIDQHNILAVSLYEKYIVYSVALNCANTINKDMQEIYGWELYKFRQ